MNDIQSAFLTTLLIFAPVGATLSLSSCKHKETSSVGPVLYEEAIVTSKTFSPSRTETSISFSTDADGNLTPHTSTDYIPERFSVGFRCQHGSFVIDDHKAKDLYHKLLEGETVSVAYQEVTKHHHEKIDGEWVEQYSYFHDYKFLSASPIKTSGPSESE